MASSEISDAENSASYRKVAQLHTAFKKHIDNEYIENILRKEGNINYKIKNSNKEARVYAEFGILFLAADDYMYLQSFESLLNNGADFTIKDNEGHTIVHKILRKHYKKANSSYTVGLNQFIEAVMSAHVKFGNKSNPSCKDNISHFHATCKVNHAEAVTFFLKNGVNVNEAVNENSSIYAGYTPLHFAVEFICPQAVEILLKNQADMHLKNVSGLSPLDISLERVINGKAWEWREVEGNILEILAKHFIKENENNNFGFTNLHLACVLKDTSIVESVLSNQSFDVNQQIKLDSPICAGYTPLHFAAIFSVDTVKLLIDRGADFEVKDAHGTTPFDLCLQTHKFEDIKYIISSQKRWKDIILSDNKTKLVNVIEAMTNKDDFQEYLTNFESIADLKIPTDSPLWPGYTILHIAVVLSEVFLEPVTHIPNYYGWTSDTAKVEKCLDRGVDITKTDVNNQTALHLAFYMQKYLTVELLLRHYETFANPSDNNGLSHFHIACIAQDESVVEKFLSNGKLDVNVPVNASDLKWKALLRSYMDNHSKYFFPLPGSTALHMNVTCGNAKITKMLLENKADVYAKDCHGFTPIHRLFANCVTTSTINEEIINLLLGIDDLKDSVTEGGLTHLHVASMLGNENAVEKLLDSGADINAIIVYPAVNKFIEEAEYYQDHYLGPSKGLLPYLSRYSMYTSLHFAICHWKFEIQKLLVGRGADMTVGNFSICVPAEKVFGDDHEFDEIVLTVLEENITLKSRLRDQFSMTMLHIACYVNKSELVNDLLLQGQDVNSRVDCKSPIWPGDTPLHVVVRNIKYYKFQDNKDLFGILVLLLKNGADVTLENEDGDTPLHLLSRISRSPITNCKYAHLLLDALEDFNIEKANSQNVSFFHFACLMKNESIVKKFLENGIDVNKPVDFFADRYTGCTPLHLTMTDRYGELESYLSIINLLLKYGADVCAKDVYDNTTLHIAAEVAIVSHEIFYVLIRKGVDINAVNIRGETALELLLKSENITWVKVECLLKNGSSINYFNSITEEGYFGKNLYSPYINEWKALENDMMQKFINSEYINVVDDEGRTILHNLVCVSKVNIVDHVELIDRLVKRGCDINHQDKEGRTPLHLATYFRNSLGLLALLKNGADTNITDKQGKTAFNYCFETPQNPKNYDDYYDPNNVLNLFAIHTSKMEICGLNVSEINKQLKIDALERLNLDDDTMNRFDEDLKKSKEVKIGSSDFTLYDFGFKIDAEMDYPNIPYTDRSEIDQFFQKIEEYNLHELDYMLKIKYKNAVERLRLINLADEPFNVLIRNQLPDLCRRMIIIYLSISDLKNVIATKSL